MSSYEVVIHSGLVIDGQGTEPYRANIGVSGGKIARISAEPLAGAVEIDATDHIVCPGFIDLHSHADYTVEAGPAADGQLFQGVTTVVTGNCGWSPFPVQNLEELKTWSEFLGADLSWNWTDVAGFAATVNQSRPAINVAPQVGHIAVRLAAMGGARRAPTASEMQTMGKLITQAAGQGAWGFSSGLIYAPGSFATPQEMDQLVAFASSAGLLYSTHMRNESAQLLAAVAEAIEATERANGRLEISHLKVMGDANQGAVGAALEMIDAARQRGVDVAADVYPYTASGTTLTSRLPDWATDGGWDALAKRLASVADRAKIADSLTQRTGVDINWSGVVLGQLGEGTFQRFEGVSIADVGLELEISPVDAALAIIEAHRGVVPIINHAMSEDDLRHVLAHPWVSVASDGDELTSTGTSVTHPRSFGTFPRVLGRYVRDLGVIDLPDAVRKMTSLPADRLGMKNRGRLAVGMIADITVFDAHRILDRATFANSRQLSVGVKDVLVSGIPALASGVVTGKRNGTVLLKNQVN